MIFQMGEVFPGRVENRRLVAFELSRLLSNVFVQVVISCFLTFVDAYSNSNSLVSTRSHESNINAASSEEQIVEKSFLIIYLLRET